jgi:hypothetical protein
MGANSFSLLAAASGFLASYWNSKIVEERKARIERVNEQLREFVGPLLATVGTSRSAWAAMVAQSGQGEPRAFQDAVAADPAGPEAEAYRAWMTSVLQPLNEKGACARARARGAASHPSKEKKARRRPASPPPTSHISHRPALLLGRAHAPATPLSPKQKKHPKTENHSRRPRL